MYLHKILLIWARQVKISSFSLIKFLILSALMSVKQFATVLRLLVVLVRITDNKENPIEATSDVENFCFLKIM